MDALRPILEREMPNHLKELKIIDCKIPSEVSKSLVEELYKKCTLQRLSLVHCNLLDPTFKLLLKLVEEAFDLE